MLQQPQEKMNREVINFVSNPMLVEVFRNQRTTYWNTVNFLYFPFTLTEHG